MTCGVGKTYGYFEVGREMRLRIRKEYGKTIEIQKKEFEF